MAEYVMNASAMVPCGHRSGVATLMTSGVTRVRLSGQPAVLVLDTASVACSVSNPCAQAQWTKGAERVRSMNRPLVLKSSQSVVVPSGKPLMAQQAVTQVRVKAT